MRYIGFLAALALATAPLSTPAAAQDTPAAPADGAVFELVTVTRAPDGQYKGAGYGTAFFVGQDGTAYTNTHVVYRAQHDPDHYQLLAIVGSEFYAASIVCATRLQYDPTKPHPTGIDLGHDVAVIRLETPSLPFTKWGYRPQGGDFLEVAHAHEGPLPAFPTLTISPHGPSEGETVRVIGFGHISPFPEKWMATGQVAKTFRLLDGTQVFTIQFENPAEPGNSGSPVLDEQGRAVGIYTWYSLYRSDTGTGQSAAALNPSCR